MATPSVRKGKIAEDQERVIAFLAQGISTEEAMRRVGRQGATMYIWRKNSESFKARTDKISERLKGKDRDVVSEDGEAIDTRTLRGFRKHYFGYDTYPHQQQMIDAIEGANPGSVTMILIPPEWMKTTTTEDYLCMRLGEEPNLRVCYLSEGLAHATKCLGRIQRRMTDRSIAENYIDDFGPFKAPERAMSKVWNSAAIQLFRSTHDERDYSLTCRGSTSTIYGSRYDLMVIDDIQSLKSLNRTKTLVSTFRQDWKTRVPKTGKIVIIGTRVGRGDFYQELLDLNLVDNVVLIPALDLSKPVGEQSNFPAQFDENGDRVVSATGDPIGWSDEELAERRDDMGPEVWDRVYMQSDRSNGAGSFTEEIINKAWDHWRDLGSPRNGHKGIARMSGIDPALGGYCALVSCSYDADRLYVEGIRNVPRLNRTEEIFALMEQETIEHLPDVWVFERNNLQHGMARDDRLMELRDKYGFAVVEHFTSDNKFDPSIGIPSMASAMNRGEIRLPGTPEARMSIQDLVDELLDWRHDVPTKLLRQDLVMALWFVYLRWINVRKGLSSDLSAFDRSGSPSFTSYQTTLGGWR